MSQPIYIYASNKKFYMYLTFVFVLICSVWWLFERGEFTFYPIKEFGSSHLEFYFFALLTPLAFIGIIFMIVKFKNKTPCLVISEQGIIENTNMCSMGLLIDWNDIEGFEVKIVEHQRQIYILLKDSEIYLKRLNKFKRLISWSTKKMCGSPAIISVTFLEIKLDDLMNILNTQFEIHKKKVKIR